MRVIPETLSNGIDVLTRKRRVVQKPLEVDVKVRQLQQLVDCKRDKVGEWRRVEKEDMHETKQKIKIKE